MPAGAASTCWPCGLLSEKAVAGWRSIRNADDIDTTTELEEALPDYRHETVVV